MDELDYFLKLKRHQITMVKDRGYDVDNEMWVFDDITGNQFKKILTKQYGPHTIRKLMFSEYTHPERQNLVVFYVGLNGSKQIKIEFIRQFIEKMTKENKEGILIINSTLSAAANLSLTYITECDYQIFQEEELMFNLMSHVYQPQFQVLSEKEVEIIKTVLGLKPKGLSLLLQSDPVVKYYHFSSGQIVRILTPYPIDSILPYHLELAIVQ